jgi:hypothetical protein
MELERLGFKALYESGPNGIPDNLLLSSEAPGEGLTDLRVEARVSGEIALGLTTGTIAVENRLWRSSYEAAAGTNGVEAASWYE